MKNTNYFYKSWIQTCGKGWTKNQVFISYLFSVLFACAVILYSFITHLNWTGIQIFAAAWLAWDLGGGVLGYSHRAIKQKTIKEKGKLHFFHHNLLHIHPLILVFFNNSYILLGLTIYSVLSFFLYVELLEKNPKTGKRKLNNKGEKMVILFQIIVGVVLIILSYLTQNVQKDYQMSGITIYGSLLLLTILLVNIPLAFQRTSSIMMVVIMIFVSMFFIIPHGFEWFVPVYFLKLLPGYTAKEENV